MNSVRAFWGNLSHNAALFSLPHCLISIIFSLSFFHLLPCLLPHIFLSILPISLFLFTQLCNLLIFCQFLPHPHFFKPHFSPVLLPQSGFVALADIYIFFLCFFIQFYSSFSYLYSHFTLSLCFVSFCDSFSYSFWLVLSAMLLPFSHSLFQPPSNLLYLCSVYVSLLSLPLCFICLVRPYEMR